MVSKIVFCILLFSIISFQNSFATEQPGSIRGSVINKSSGEPMTNAKVTLIQDKKALKSVSTNKDGTFILDQVPPGIYDLQCKYVGFIDQRIIGLTIQEDQVKLAFFKIAYGDVITYGEDVILTHASIEVLRARSKAASSKTETSLADIPATMHIYTQEDISERGYVHLSELLQDVPQIEINERSSFSDYNIISSRGITGNEKLLILLNGVRISSMARTSHAIDKAYPIKHAERIEIILGPSSATYEADAFVGVVNIIMPNGRENIGGAVTSSYGMYHTTENAFFASFGKEKIGGHISGNFYSSQDPNMPKHYTSDYNWFNSNYKDAGSVLQNVFGNNTATLTPQEFGSRQQAYSVQGVFHLYDFEIGVTHNAQSFSSATGSKSQYSICSNDNLTGFSITNAYVKHIANSSNRGSKKKAWSLESLINWNYYESDKNSSTQNVYTNYQKAYHFAFDNNIRIRETFTYNLSPKKSAFKHQLLAGAYFRYTYALPQTSYLNKKFGQGDAIEQDLFYFGSNVIDNDGTNLKFIQNLYFTNQFNVGSFVQYGFKYKDILSITLGLQADYVTSTTQDALFKQNNSLNITPRITVVAKPFKGFRLKFFYAEAALAPSLRRQYDHYGTLQADQSADIYLKGQTWRIPSDSLLVSERVQSGEVDISYSKGNLLLITNAYFSYGENLIRDSHFHNKSFFQNRITATYAVQANNTSEAFLYGASIYAAYRLSSKKDKQFQLKLDASYSFADGQISGLTSIPFTAMHTVKGGFVIKYKFLSLSTRLIYRTASFNEGYEDEDGNFVQYGNEDYITLNLYAKGTIYENKKTGIGIDVFTKINNLTNNLYYHTTDNNPISMGAVPQLPILILGGVNFRILR